MFYKKVICSRNIITLWFQALVMGNKNNFWSINTMCTHHIASELHSSLPHLFTILYSILCFLIIFYCRSCLGNWELKQEIALLDYFTAAFKEVEPTENYKFLWLDGPCHKKKKLYASLVFKTLKIQLYDSSIDIVRLASKHRKILSWFITLLKKTPKNIVGKNREGQTFNTYIKNSDQTE